MATKPAVPPKPKSLLKAARPVAPPKSSSGYTAPTPQISSPFGTTDHHEPQFFYSPSQTFQSYRSNGFEEPKSKESSFCGLPKSASSGPWRRPSLPIPGAAVAGAVAHFDTLIVCKQQQTTTSNDRIADSFRTSQPLDRGDLIKQSSTLINGSSPDSNILVAHSITESSSSVSDDAAHLHQKLNGLCLSGESEEIHSMAPEISESKSQNSCSDSPGGSLVSSDNEKSEVMLNNGLLKCHKVAAEIVSTEWDYLASLKLLLVDFPTAVQGSAPPEEIQLLLKGLPEIFKFSEILHEDLKAHLDVYMESQLIAPVFVKNGKCLNLYVSYVMDFEKMIDTYRALLKKYPNFAEMVSAFETSSACKKLPLVEYFHKPIQRLPRYPLLLGTYLRSLSENHPDRENTKRALDLVSDVTAKANTTLASLEKVSRLLWYQARTVGYTFLLANRVFIREGTLKKLSRKQPQDRIILLCSDAVICGEMDSLSKFTVKQEYLLTEIKVDTDLDCAYFEPNEFAICSTQKSFVFRAASIELRNTWTTAINRAIEDRLKLPFRKLTAKNSNATCNFAPIWIPDYRATICQLCQKQFGIFRRHHHCRICGKVVCGGCSPYEVGIDYKNNRPKRVCKSCYQAKRNGRYDGNASPDVSGSS